MNEDDAAEDETEAAADPAVAKRPWSTPRVLSAEQLEAAATTCDPPTGGFGKSAPACNPQTLGS